MKPRKKYKHVTQIFVIRGLACRRQTAIILFTHLLEIINTRNDAYQYHTNRHRIKNIQNQCQNTTLYDDVQ